MSEETDVYVVEFKEDFEEQWGDKEHQTNDRVLFDVDEYDENFSEVVKELDWNNVHYDVEKDEDDNWLGWSIDKDSIERVKTHFYNRGYTCVDLREDNG